MEAAGWILCVLTAVSGQSPRAPLPPSIAIQHCLVSLIDEAQVPAKEHGVIVQLNAAEGQTVAAGDVLARIDDADAQAALRVADFKLKQAKEEASSDVNIRYSKAAAEVAQADYQAALDANNRQKGTYPPGEIRRYWLIWTRAALESEKATMDFRVAALKASEGEAEMQAAQENVDRRKICAPLAGAIVEVKRHTGEWVQPGDMVAHVVRLDRLRIEGFINAAKAEPGEIAERPVSVTVGLARGHQETFTGKVVFVSPLVQAGGEYRVWAEVTNRQQNGQWLLRPGLEAEMTIQLK